MGTTTSETKTDTGALAEVFEELYEPQPLDIERPTGDADRVTVIAAPKNIILHNLKPYFDAWAKQPERRKGTAHVRDAESFTEHVNRHKGADSVIFANPDRTSPKLLGVYDYNPAGDDITDARYMQHRVEYSVQTSDEWKAWMGINGKPLDPRTFAEFIEDRIADVMNPGDGDAKLDAISDLLRGSWASPPTLIGLSRGIEVSIASKVKHATTLASGEISVAFEEVHNDGAGQPLKVPNLFLIGIPVFYKGDRFPIVAKLRYRVDGSSLRWSIALHQPDVAFDKAFDELCTEVEADTGLPMFRGTPETA